MKRMLDWFRDLILTPLQVILYLPTAMVSIGVVSSLILEETRELRKDIEEFKKYLEKFNVNVNKY